MAKNKPIPLKEESKISLDDIYAKLEEQAVSIKSLQKEPCEPVTPKFNIQVKGLHFKTEEEFQEKVILLYKGLAAYNQEQEDAYIKELHDKGELSNRELLMAIYSKLFPKHVSVQSSQSQRKVRLTRLLQKVKTSVHIVLYEPSNKWYRNVYAWISIVLTLMFTTFTIYEVINVNRLKAYNENLRTIAAQHQMTREVVREFHPDLFVTINSYDDMVRSKGYNYAHEHFENSKPKEKPRK